jgi:ketosteroid isomerase-like protein
VSETTDLTEAEMHDLGDRLVTAIAAGGALQMPAMIRFWVADGRITRLEEYLDTRQAIVLYSPA